MSVDFGHQLVDGHTKFRKLGSVKLSLHAPGLVNAVAISQDGTLMASADDGGGLEIRLYNVNLHRWELVRKYTRGGQIRTLCWWRASPSAPWALFLGSSYGLVWKIALTFIERNCYSKELDVIHRAKVDGYVHSLSVSANGKLIVASGDTVKLYDRPFQNKNDLGPPLLFQDVAPITTTDEHAEFEAQYDIRWVPRVRRFHFLQDDMVLLTFFGRVGIHIFSTTNGIQQYSVPLRQGQIIGSSALSSGGDILAVSNLCDGVDWYSISLKKYLMTTRFDVAPPPMRNIIVDLTFVDQATVAVGHSRGDFVVATFGFPDPIRHEENQGSRNMNDFSPAVSNIAFGVTESKYLIVRPAMSNTGKSSRRIILQVRQILASKDRIRRLAEESGEPKHQGLQAQFHLLCRSVILGFFKLCRSVIQSAIKNYHISLSLVSIWGAINVFIYTGNLLRVSFPLFMATSTPGVVIETKYITTTVTMISMAQATQTTTSVSTITNWQTVTMTPPPTSSACFCTVMLSGVLQQAQVAVETGLSAGDNPSYIDQSSLNM